MKTKGNSAEQKTLGVLKTPGRRMADRLGVLVLFVCSLALYIRTLAPSVVTVFDDSPEFQLVCYLLGVAHPTGYPLYTLLGKAFSYLPVGDVAYRINLMSAFFGALAVAGCGFLVRRLSQSWLAGGLAGLALAVSPVFWGEATIAEVYTLHAFLIVVALILLTNWDRGGERSAGMLVALAAVIGLGLAHHRTIALFLPGFLFVVYMVWRRRADAARRQDERPVWPAWQPVLLALAIPLLLYLYIPLIGARVGSLDGRYENTIAGFLRHVLALDYQVFIAENPLDQSRDLLFYLALLREQYGIPGAVLGLAGLAIPWRRRRIWCAVLLSLVFNTVFALLYSVADIEVFLIPVFILWAIGIGMALGRLSGWIHDIGRHVHLESRLAKAFSAALIGAFVFQPWLVAHAAWPEADRSRSWGVHDAGYATLSHPLPEGATIIGILGEMTILRYFQFTQGLRTDIHTVAANREGERWEALETTIRQSGEAYLTRRLPGAEEVFQLDAAGPLIRVRPKEEPIAATCGGDLLLHELCLENASLSIRETTNRTVVELDLDWLAVGSIGRDVRVSARLLSSAGHNLGQHDSRPVHETYPTTVWRPGERVHDVYEIWVSPGTPTGRYDVVLVLYDPYDGTELARRQLESIELTGVHASPPNRDYDADVLTDAMWPGGLALLGHGAAMPAYAPGDRLSQVLLWKIAARATPARSVQLWLDGEDGRRPVAGEAIPGIPGLGGGVVRQWFDAPLPADLVDGRYSLLVTVEEDGRALRFGPAWLLGLPLHERVYLGEFDVLGRPRQFDIPPTDHSGDVLFGEGIRLLGWEWPPIQPAPGQELHVRLVWQALASSRTSYSVFVHVVNQGGEIVAQYDGIPGEGRAPTTSWVAGEVIDDHLLILLPSGLPSGLYTILVGVYDPVTGLRLPAGGEYQGVEADRVFLAEIALP